MSLNPETAQRREHKMPICSYIVYPQAGQCVPLTTRLNALTGCDATAAENRELIVLVTETNSQAEEKELQATLARIPDIQCLAMTFEQVTPPEPEMLKPKMNKELLP